MTNKTQYQVQRGITDKQIDELIYHALNDSVIHTFTGDKERFRDRKSFDQWHKKSTEIFVLTDDKKQLLGIVWFEPLALPQAHFTRSLDTASYTITFAIRLYTEARGKGLGKWFLNKVLEMVHYPNVWLKTSHDNVPALRLYKRFGFEQVSIPDAQGKIVMIGHFK